MRNISLYSLTLSSLHESPFLAGVRNHLNVRNSRFNNLFTSAIGNFRSMRVTNSVFSNILDSAINTERTEIYAHSDIKPVDSFYILKRNIYRNIRSNKNGIAISIINYGCTVVFANLTFINCTQQSPFDKQQGIIYAEVEDIDIEQCCAMQCSVSTSGSFCSIIGESDTKKTSVKIDSLSILDVSNSHRTTLGSMYFKNVKVESISQLNISKSKIEYGVSGLYLEGSICAKLEFANFQNLQSTSVLYTGTDSTLMLQKCNFIDSIVKQALDGSSSIIKIEDSIFKKVEGQIAKEEAERTQLKIEIKSCKTDGTLRILEFNDIVKDDQIELNQINIGSCYYGEEEDEAPAMPQRTRPPAPELPAAARKSPDEAPRMAVISAVPILTIVAVGVAFAIFASRSNRDRRFEKMDLELDQPNPEDI